MFASHGTGRNCIIGSLSAPIRAEGVLRGNWAAWGRGSGPFATAISFSCWMTGGGTSPEVSLQHVDVSAPPGRSSSVDPASPAPSVPRERRPSRLQVGRRTPIGLHRASVAVLILGLTTAVVTTVLLQHAVADTEAKQLAERGREAALVVEAFVANYEAPLQTGAAVLHQIGPDPAAFTLLAQSVVGHGNTAVAAALMRVPATGSIASPGQIVARVGAPLAFSAAPGTAIAPVNGDLTLVNIYSSAGHRLGAAVGPPAMPAGYALYAESPFPLGTEVHGNAAFSELRYAVYLGTRQDPTNRLFGSAVRPITGTRNVRFIDAGNSTLLLVVAPRGHLSGALTVALPWIILSIFLVATAVGTIAVETIGRRRDEAVQTAEELSERSAELVTAQAELAVMNAGLEHEVEQRTSELRSANRELEAFAYAVSHDLRAPLRAIDGFSLALLEDEAERLDETGRDYLNRVRAATSRMSTLIDDILELSRVTRGDMQRQLVDLSAMSREILARCAELDPHRVVETVVPDGIFARGDPRLLRVALENLLGNAWKFTGPAKDARIEFGRTSDAGTTTYFVRDNGVGFDGEHAGNLFAPFKRLHSMDEFEGNGIGLATVARVIDRHGGHIWARSAVGSGATFYFTCGGTNGDEV
jgi:signal transduction histidine kinase